LKSWKKVMTKRKTLSNLIFTNQLSMKSVFILFYFILCVIVASFGQEDACHKNKCKLVSVDTLSMVEYNIFVFNNKHRDRFTVLSEKKECTFFTTWRYLKKNKKYCLKFRKVDIIKIKGAGLPIFNGFIINDKLVLQPGESFYMTDQISNLKIRD
jgi:hypothetical protein